MITPAHKGPRQLTFRIRRREFTSEGNPSLLITDRHGVLSFTHRRYILHGMAKQNLTNLEDATPSLIEPTSGPPRWAPPRFYASSGLLVPFLVGRRFHSEGLTQTRLELPHLVVTFACCRLEQKHWLLLLSLLKRPRDRCGCIALGIEGSCQDFGNPAVLLMTFDIRP